jgi:hypothetical protein
LIISGEHDNSKKLLGGSLLADEKAKDRLPASEKK